jgi:hypothetical protein
MKKTILISFIIYLSGFTLFAQKFELKIDAGANLAFIPEFENRILITKGGLVIPNWVVRVNSNEVPIIGTAVSETSPGFGLFADLEIGMNLSDKFNLSLLAGVNQMTYTYDTYVDFDEAPPGYLSELDANYGKTNLLYIDLKPVNLSVNLFKNKMSLQSGPSFNFLLHSEQNNIIIHYTEYLSLDGVPYKVMDKLHFDSTDSLNKVMYGWYLRSGFRIIKQLELFVSGQFYFNSLYKNYDTYYQYVSACKPIQLQAGLSYAIWKFGKTKF